jgi:hypothetical protein
MQADVRASVRMAAAAVGLEAAGGVELLIEPVANAQWVDQIKVRGARPVDRKSSTHKRERWIRKSTDTIK